MALSSEAVRKLAQAMADQGAAQEIGTVVDGKAVLASANTFTAANTFQAAVTFSGVTVTFSGATGTNIIALTDNLADALSFKESSTAYVTFTTTNGSEAVKILKNLVLSADFTDNFTTATDDGAVTAKSGTVFVTKAGVAALTLADPTATTDDGKVLRVISTTAQAHTLSNAAGSGYNGAGAAGDVATFGGAIGDNIVLVAYQGVWHILSSVNITLG